MKVKIVNRSTHALPEYKTKASAGMDIRANLEQTVVLKPLERILIPTGLYIELPVGYEAQIRPRSGLALNEGLGILNSPGTIDADYRGEVKVALHNDSEVVRTIVVGQKVAQMVIVPFLSVEFDLVDELSDTVRGAGGFGSTGKL